jgi:transcriptional regulator with XRE-family HTH domain
VELGPTRAARRLRADLRRAREVAGLTQNEVADQLGLSPSKVMRVESGAVGISSTDLRAFCHVYELGDAVFRELDRMNRAAQVRGWWHEYRDYMSAALVEVVGLEAGADRLCMFTTGHVPRLLQTREYARVVLDDSPQLSVLLRRQAEVFDQSDPPEVFAVIDESVLYHPTGGPETMAAQVRRLAELGRRPAVEIRVLPFESPVGRWQSFAMVGDEVVGTLVHMELTHADLVVDDTQAETYLEHFDELRENALDPARTAQVLHRVADSYEAGRQPRPWLWL